MNVFDDFLPQKEAGAIHSYIMGRIIDDELIVLDEDNPMEEIKNYTKKRRLSDKSKKEIKKVKEKN